MGVHYSEGTFETGGLSNDRSAGDYSNQLGIAMLDHPHHIATVTGDAIMLPPDTLGARIAFVDYDGGKLMIIT